VSYVGTVVGGKNGIALNRPAEWNLVHLTAGPGVCDGFKNCSGGSKKGDSNRPGVGSDFSIETKAWEKEGGKQLQDFLSWVGKFGMGGPAMK